jgi:hypothetical protein
MAVDMELMGVVSLLSRHAWYPLSDGLPREIAGYHDVRLRSLLDLRECPENSQGANRRYTEIITCICKLAKEMRSSSIIERHGLLA